jgi:CheY-like chemotaxis protein
MDISLLTSGNLTAINKGFLLVSMLETLYDHYNLIVADKDLELRLDIPGNSENISLNSDEEILNKIMSHLLDNAIKFTEKGFIHFGFKRIGDSLEFFVRDTGVGISNNSLARIFDRFIKGDHVPVKQSEGSGLGLPIARGMIEIIGGKIRVESVLGEGSSFSFNIPLIQNIKQESISLSFENDLIMNNQMILVAEDDETNFFYLNALLKMETQATVLHASNGREAIDMFKENPGIGLILMDIKMPEIDGLEATRQIKLINSEIPIIAITAYAMSGDKERVLAAGCDDYLSKPINKKNLLKKMEELYKV